MRVIVTNAKNRIAYATVRSLGQKGLEVYTSDFVNTSMAFYSRYSCGHFLYPSPFRYPNEFIKVLIGQIKKLKCEVLIPVYEETFLISKYQNILSDYVNIVVPEYDSLLSVHDKKKLYSIAKGLGIQVPMTVSVVDVKNNESIIDDLRFPVLLKPRQGGGAWGIVKISDPENLKQIIKHKQYPDGLEEERFFVQEKIFGQVYCCAMLFNKGSYRAGHCYRQLRETPLSGGTATFRESVIHPQLIEKCKRLLGALQWHGVCHTDFIIEKTTGVPYLIDANPRLWGALFQGIISGVDFPYLLYKIAVDGDVKPVYKYETKMKTRWIGGDLKCFLEYLKNPSGCEGINLLDFIKVDKYERFDDFDVKDPLPFIMWCADYFCKILKQRSFSPSPHDSLEGVWE